MDIRSIAAWFDERAANYSNNEWHRHYAEQLIELASLQPNQRVLDAGVGTGFAAVAIACRVAPAGEVVGIDISQGMLDKAAAAIDAAGITGVQLLEGDAADLPAFADGTFDAVICSAALLYMPVDKALREWHRLLEENGIVGFSTMRAGSPPAGRLFRECAEAFGVPLEDPSAALGSEDRCQAALEAAGFSRVKIVTRHVDFLPVDLAYAWESNLRSEGHAAVRELSAADQQVLRTRYELEIRRAQADDARALARADVLHAFGRKGRRDKGEGTRD